MFERLLQRFAGTAGEAARKIQMTGLVQSARWAAKLLGEPPPDPERMPDWIEAILEAVTARMCRYESDGMPAPAECGALDNTRRFMEGIPLETRREFQSLLVLIELSPYVLGPRRERFTQLEGAYQDAALQLWEQSDLPPQRAGFNAIKSMVMMGYWSRPETWSSIGYSIADNPGVPQPQQSRWEDIEEEAR